MHATGLGPASRSRSHLRGISDGRNVPVDCLEIAEAPNPSGTVQEHHKQDYDNPPCSRNSWRRLSALRGPRCLRWANYSFLAVQTAYMGEATLDARGRLTLPKPLREQYGDRYRIVETHHGLKLIPVEEEPLGALREEFANLDEPPAKLRKTRQEALEQAGGRTRRPTSS